MLAVVACGSTEPAVAVDAGDESDRDGANEVCRPCPSVNVIETVGAAPLELGEATGLAATLDRFYAITNMGEPRVFVLDKTGAPLAVLDVLDAANVDWEDMALGHDHQTIYVGDIGDDNGDRDVKTVYRFQAPAFPLESSMLSATAEALRFRYPNDVRHDAETLLVKDLEVYVVTKEPPGVPSRVYAFPQPVDPESIVTLAHVATLPFPSGTDPGITGGSMHGCGDQVLFRLGNDRLYALDSPRGTRFEFDGEPRELPISQQPTGKTIAWSVWGSTYFTLGEGAAAPLVGFGCNGAVQ
jgi:hypothetical protein